MKLIEYIRTEEKLTPFATRIGRPVNTVHGWASGKRKPSVDDAFMLERETGGKVPASSFADESQADAA